jgi:hypothetical protein
MTDRYELDDRSWELISDLVLPGKDAAGSAKMIA